MAESTFARLFNKVTGVVDRVRGWDRLPLPLGLLELIGIRDTLRQENLYDTGGDPLPGTEPTSPTPGRWLGARSIDGAYNDLDHPEMGMAGMRFGRNVPLEAAVPDETTLMTPSPRAVSRELMTRHQFIPATTLNVLAAAWLQFEVHDWFSHGGSDKSRLFSVPLAEEDDWPDRPMQIAATQADPTAAPDEPPTFRNTETHWWDGSQIYGSSAPLQALIRSGIGGRVRLDPHGNLPIDPATLKDTGGVTGNWWLGLTMMHTLFMREHNAIAERLAAEYPAWSDDELFDKARLINTALIAKIHTVEWTTAILGHPTLQVGMRANWWGVIGQRLHELVGGIGHDEVINGIPGSQTNHHTAPYAMTEEFVAVYRMHPLIPDDYEFRAATDDSLLAVADFLRIAGTNARTFLEQVSLQDAIYSFGIAHPGAITLNNFPRALQRFATQDSGMTIDLASVDILRCRERGVPRYNEFRRLMHKNPITSFDELTDDPELNLRLRKVYAGDIEAVDLPVGLYAEKPPTGFGFSDTAFRIFVLMASRRLKSDRFFTVDFTERMYTRLGLDWIEHNDMTAVLLRHFPELSPALRGVKNAFAPWTRVPHSTTAEIRLPADTAIPAKRDADSTHKVN
jgi:hypothetical protein